MPRTDILDENRLCEPCQRIDFQKVLDVDVLALQKEEDGILLADLGTRCNDLSTAKKCPLCYLCYQSRAQEMTFPQYQLRIYSYLQSTDTIFDYRCEPRHRDKDIPCIGVVPPEMPNYIFRRYADATGHLFCRKGAKDDALFNPQILTPQVALSQVKHWLDYCASHHFLCRKDEFQVTGLKLLDCETYDVVPAPEKVKYVALSYVWGTTASHSNTPVIGCDGGCEHDLRITKTIRDAATVSKSLGYSYLWVDKLCIDQGNSEEKHHQISHMDSIYGSADMTIIAACGQDSHYGLPGVNDTPRTVQHHVKAGHFDIFSSMRHPHDAIKSSKWASRGWTLQETCLSKRRLAFTDSQLYFECNTMQCRETVVPNLDMIHRPERDVYSLFFSAILSLHMDSIGQEPSSLGEQEYMNLIVQYTKRDLTYEDDRPKAFAGITRHFARKGFHEIWGIPCGSDKGVSKEVFLIGLLWTHDDADIVSWDWNPKRSTDKLLDLGKTASLPTWSWMRWRGKIEIPGFLSSDNGKNRVHDIRFEVRQDSGIEFHEYFASRPPARAEPYDGNLPKVLLLDVDCLDGTEISGEGYDLFIHGVNTAGRFGRFSISRGPLCPRALHELLQSRELELLLLCKDQWDEVYFMLVENHENFAVRVGFCVVSFEKFPEGLQVQRKRVRLV